MNILENAADMNSANRNFQKLDAQSVTKTFSGPNNTNSIIEGKLPLELGYGTIINNSDGLAKIYMAVDSTNTPILKVAKEGYDATTADDENLIFNSAQNVFKVLLSGSYTLALPGGAANTWASEGVSITIPTQTSPRLVTATMTIGSVTYMLPNTYTTGDANGYGVILLRASVYMGVNYINLGASYRIKSDGTPSITDTITFNYYILQESATV